MDFNLTNARRAIFKLEPCPVRRSTAFQLAGGTIISCAHSAIVFPASQVDAIEFYLTVRSCSTNQEAAASVLYYEPVSDILILGAPASEPKRPQLTTDFKSLLRSAATLDLFLGDPSQDEFEVFVPTARGTLISGTASVMRGARPEAPRAVIVKPNDGQFLPGDSGSPILMSDARVLALIQTVFDGPTGNGSGVLLVDALPQWVLNSAWNEADTPSWRGVVKSKWQVSHRKAG